MMNIFFERDSVCAGDDVSAPNRKNFEFATPPLLSELSSGKHVLAYLPSVSGARTKWSVIIDASVVANVWHSYADTREIEAELLEHDRTIHAGRVYFPI